MEYLKVDFSFVKFIGLGLAFDHFWSRSRTRFRLHHWYIYCKKHANLHTKNPQSHEPTKD